MRKVIFLWCLLLSSCVNPYAKFYQGVPDARVRPDYEPVQTELQIYGSDNFERDANELMRRGYVPVGQASFNAAANQVSEHQLREQAQRVGAHVVLVASKYTHTVSGAAPLVIPQTTTSYSTGTATTYGSQTIMMPYSVARSDFGALFFIKSRSRVGIAPEPLDDNTRRRLETNAGVRVKLVAESSPAFSADVLPGDVLLAIGTDAVQSLENYYKLLDKYEGQTVPFRLDRDGKRLDKQIEIRSPKKTAQPQ